MKSTALKKNGSTLTSKYAVLFAIFFLSGLLVFMEHFHEDAVTPGDLEETEKHDAVKPEVGYLAPDFTVRSLEGKRVRLSDFKGQVVVMNLWATWCAPCRVEMPSMESMYRRFRSEGLTVLAVSIDRGDDQKVKDFVREYRLSFPVMMDTDHEAEQRFPTLTIPTTFIIDREGRVAARVDGAKNWESPETFEALEFLLKLK